MMPIRWSSMAAANKPYTAFQSTITKKTSSREVAAILPRHQQATQINNAAASRMISNSPKTTSWAPDRYTALLRARQHSSQKRFQSTSPKNNSNSNNNSSGNNTFTTLSSLAHFLTASTGTFASTIIALYLATVVETSAHEFLYDHFPHWYDEVPLEELPTCLKNRAIERSLGKLNSREKGLGEVEEGTVVDDFGLMGMDGWMEQQGQSSSILLAELEFEKRQETSAWQRKMTEKRADIIHQEEEDFSRGFLPAADSFSSSAKNGLVETKRIHEEASMKLQERLMSVAMTA